MLSFGFCMSKPPQGWSELDDLGKTLCHHCRFRRSHQAIDVKTQSSNASIEWLTYKVPLISEGMVFYSFMAEGCISRKKKRAQKTNIYGILISEI